ncbi:hypothetical protein DFH06DRAFT_1149005 [Mycena polygramma]|nr:hypothetical protein DFH06DRAFT_1149005 [Mycena polygramma]
MPLCDCTVYGCNTRDKTGKWWLTTYQLRQHHRTEQRQADLLKEVEEEQAEEAIRALRQQKLDVKAAEDEEKRQAARERRERKEEERNRRCHGVDEALEAIRRHDVDVTALMSQLSLSPPPSVAPRPDRNYRGDREKAQVEIWGKIMDVQDELKADLEFLTLPPPELRIGELRAGVAKIGSLAQRANVLKRHIASLQNAGRKPASVEVLIETVWMESKSLDDAIGDALKAWNESITQQLRLRTNDRASTFQTSHLHQPIFGDAFAAIQVIMFMVVVCSTVLSLSRRGCSWLLDMSCAALSEAFDMASGRSRHMDKITNTFPRDVPTVVKHFRLDTKSQVYAACPECHHIHAALRTDPLPEYQERCNYRRYNRGKKCKAVLTRPVTVSGATRMVPIKPFVSFDFRDWLARLMARKDVEEKMDRKWDHLKKDPTTMSKEELQAEAAEGLSDVFDGSFIRRCLCTRDVKRGTRKSRKNRKKRAVRKDAEDRVDEEEQEKAAEVAELEAGGEDGEAGEAGEAGEGGRNTPIPEPAFEGGEGGNRVGYNDFDIKSWKLRTGSQCRVWAELYQTAPTQRDAQKKQGDLPSVLDIVIPPSADNPRPLKPTEIKSLEKALKALSEPMTERLKNPAERKKISDLTIWKKLNQKAAIHIAKGVGCTGLYRVRPCRHADGMETEDEPLHVVTDRLIKVEDMVEKILDWRASQVEKVLEREEAPDVELITKEEKAELWSDLATMTKPSWMTSVPPQIGGESSDGKLKVPTNYKPGEYEATIGHKYHRTSNLRMMSDTRTFPEALKSLTKIFDKLLRPQTRNVFLDDERSTAGSETRNVKGSPADPEIAAAFRRVADSLGSPNAMPSKVLTPSSTTYNGIRYTTNSRHKGNSSVIVAGADGTDIPMVIQTIVQDAQRPEHIFLATKRVNAMDIDDDPFEAYPVLAAKIWSHLEDLDPELDIIYPSEITSHFVSCEMEVKTVAGEPARAAVILPLRKSILLEYEEEDEEELEDADAMQL